MGVWQVCFVAAHCLCLIRQWHNMTRNNAGCQQLSSQKKKDDTLVNTHALSICVRAWLSVTTRTLEGLPSEQMALSNTSVWSIRRYSAQEVWRHILRTRLQNSHQHARKYAFTETHTQTRASGSAACDPWLINFSPHDRDATRRHRHRCIIRQQHTHTRAHSNTNTRTIVALIKDYSLQRQRWMWLTSCPFFAGETDTRTYTQTWSPDFIPAATACWMDVSLWQRMYCCHCYSNGWLKQQYGNQGRQSLCLQIIRLSALHTRQLVTVRGLPSQIAHNARVRWFVRARVCRRKTGRQWRGLANQCLHNNLSLMRIYVCSTTFM